LKDILEKLKITKNKRNKKNSHINPRLIILVEVFQEMRML